MRRLNIPEIGTLITLAEDWTFDLYNEYRNKSLFEVMGLTYVDSWRDRPGPRAVTIPAGTTLRIDRIYIRKGNSDYSSLSFLWPGMKTTKRTETGRGRYIGGPNEGQAWTHQWVIPARGVRFWAKLADVNRMSLTE